MKIGDVVNTILELCESVTMFDMSHNVSWTIPMWSCVNNRSKMSTKFGLRRMISPVIPEVILIRHQIISNYIN